MPLFRKGGLLAGALFAGALFSGQDANTPVDPPITPTGGGGGSWGHRNHYLKPSQAENIRHLLDDDEEIISIVIALVTENII